MNRKYAAVFLVTLILLVGVALVILAPPVSQVTQTACLKSGETCLRFPTMTGATLTGETLTIPDDFMGDYSLVIVPFTEEQQIKAETWLPFARELAAENPQLSYYNLPVFPDISPPIRTFIRTGMSVAITDAELRALTITVFLEDRETLLEALQISDTEQIQVFLLNDGGEVLWRGQDIFTSDQGKALAQIMRSRN